MIISFLFSNECTAVVVVANSFCFVFTLEFNPLLLQLKQTPKRKTASLAFTHKPVHFFNTYRTFCSRV